MNLYLAGPMRGIRDFNFPAFFEHAKLLKDAGFEVFDPAQHDVDIYGHDFYRSRTGSFKDLDGSGFDLRTSLFADMQYICLFADGIATLPGWQNSKGAKAEVALAEALGLPVRSTLAWLTSPGSRRRQRLIEQWL